MTPAGVSGDEQQNYAPSSPQAKPKSGMTTSTEGSNSDHKDDDIDAETLDESISKMKIKKKKKKKMTRNQDSNSPATLNEQGDDKSSASGIENKTIASTTSTKKSKTKKKKKKTNALDDAESGDAVPVASTQKSPKKKKKKIPKDGESPDVTPVHSARSMVDPDNSIKSSGKKSKSAKSPKIKTKKKKTKSANGNEQTVPDIERSKSLDLVPGQSGNGIPRRTMSMDQGQQTNFSIRRTLSLDAANAQFRPGPPMHGGRMNSNWGGRGRAPGGRGRGPATVTGRGRGRGRGAPPGGWQTRSMGPSERMQNGDMSFAARSSSHERLPYGNRHPSQERYGNRGLSQDRSHHSVNRSQHSRDRSQNSRDRSHHSYGGIRNVPYHDRSSYEGRSPSQERSQYGNPRNTDRRLVVPPQRGRRPMSPNKSTFDGSPPTSSHSHGNMYRAPSRPKSILRNSNHNGMISGSSHHRSIGTASSHSSSQHGRRVNIDLNASSGHSRRSRGRSRSRKYDVQSSFGSDIDSSDIESDGDDDSSFALEGSKHRRNAKKVPSTVNKGFSRTLSGLGNNSSHHGNNSSHHGVSLFKGQGQSTRSLLSIERAEFQGENIFIRALRYIHFLAPHPDEDPIKKKIRIITWCALFCDSLNALVAIITWQGETSKCCGQSIFSTLDQGGAERVKKDFDSEVFDTAVAVTTYLYMLLIFLEVVPVMRDRFPFNLINPFIGFLITFAVFFSDSIVEAASMWVFEALAVTCEGINYRLRLKRFAKRKARLKNTKKEIEKLRKLKRMVKDQYENGGGKVLTRGNSGQFVLDLNDSSSFAEDSSFKDDIETQHNSVDLNTVTGRTAVTAVSTHRETRLLRERRQLIRSLADQEQDLRVHLIGVASNTFLVVFSLLMIIFIAKNGGMCISGMQMSNPFKDSFGLCDQCVDSDGNFLANEDGYCEKCNYDDPTMNQCYYPYGGSIQRPGLRF